MTKILTFLKKNIQAITCITGLLTLLIALLNYMYQKKQKSNEHYINILKSKLELIYSPLYLNLTTNNEYLLSKDKNFINNFYKYNYLLDNNIKIMILNIIEIENLPLFWEIDNYDLIKKYNTLIKDLKTSLSLEYQKLERVYSKTYRTIEIKFINATADNFCIFIANICTYCFCAFLFVAFLVQLYKKNLNNPQDILAFSIGTIFLLSILGPIFKLLTFIQNCIKYFLRKKKIYSHTTLVPEDGYYECCCCHHRKFYYKNTLFDYCEHNSLLGFIMSGKWKQLDSNDITNKKCLIFRHLT